MKEFKDNLKFSWRYAKDQKWVLIGYIVCNIIAVLTGIFVPILGANVIVALTSNQFEQLILISLVIVGVEVLRNLVNSFSRYSSSLIYRETFTKIQSALGAEITRLENKCIDENGSGVFIHRLTSDTSNMADIFNTLNMDISNIVMNIGVFIAIFIINKIVFIYFFLIVTSMFIVNYIKTKKYNAKDKLYRESREKTSSFVGEIVRGVRDIKMLNAENNFIQELKTKVIDNNKKKYEMNSILRNYDLAAYLLEDIGNFGLICLLVFLITNSSLTVASSLILYNYKSNVTWVIYYLNNLLERVKSFNLSSSRVFSIIEGGEFTKETFGSKHLDHVEGNFAFHNVSFSYIDNEKILEDISFDVAANETVAFVGKSGSGKSTIFNLLCKMYDVDAGKITIDGVDIMELDKDTIRSNITIISQNPYIFNVSIRDNLRLVKENLTEEEMIEACKSACLHDFIMNLPNQYDTIIGEGGVNLSGGERQRLAIARAFVQKTEIILFDEATSALDNETQSGIQKAIDNMKNEYTILIIAHRFSTIINSDRIYFLNNGKIEAVGTHLELLKTNENYKLLYEAELKKE